MAVVWPQGDEHLAGWPICHVKEQPLYNSGNSANGVVFEQAIQVISMLRSSLDC